MNAGLIVGNVFDKSGNHVCDAQVFMTDVRGMNGRKIKATGGATTDHGTPIAETDSDGYFELTFGWSGTDIANPVEHGSRAVITVVAAINQRNGNRSTMYQSAYYTITGLMIKDVLGQAGLTTNVFSGMPEMLNFGKDLIDSYRKMRSHPLFSVGMLTTESWLILSAANLVINKY